MKMIKKTKIAVLALIMPLLLVLFPVHAFAATPCDPSPGSGGLLLGASRNVFTPWYEYLPGEIDDSTGKCVAKFPDKGGSTDVQKGVVLILIAVLELLTRISALVAVIFVIYGSVQYIVSQGDQQGIANAKSTITNALVGFVITVLATGIVQFLGRALQ